MLLQEPFWWERLLFLLNNFMKSHSYLYYSMPILSDIFVFSYPIFLVILFLYWVFYKNETIKKASLWIFFVTLFSAFINIWIQTFFIKSRPFVFFDFISNSSSNSLLHNFLPTSSFPSDHALVSMAFAVSVFLYSKKNNNKLLLVFSSIFLLFSLIMWYARISLGLHWPTDIIWGYSLWIFLPILFIETWFLTLMEKYLIDPIIKFQNWLFSFWKK